MYSTEQFFKSPFKLYENVCDKLIIQHFNLVLLIWKNFQVWISILFIIVCLCLLNIRLIVSKGNIYLFKIEDVNTGTFAVGYVYSKWGKNI